MAGTGTAVMTTADGAAVAMAAASTLAQCAALLCEVGRETYVRASVALGGGTIGQHVRHSLDHFAAALTGRVSGLIVYDLRDRGTSIETDPAAAVGLIDRLVGQLHELTASELAEAVKVQVMLSGDGRQATLASTLERELWFASHHAIHHHAMIGAIAREFGVATAPDFGKAPSTIDHEHRAAAGR